METYWLTGVTNCAGNTLVDRHKVNQDWLSVPGTQSSKSSLMSSVEMVASTDLLCKRHERTDSLRSIATMQRAGSFRQRERTKSTSLSTASRSAESLAALCQTRPTDTLSMLNASDNEQMSLLARDNSAIVSPITIQVDECF